MLSLIHPHSFSSLLRIGDLFNSNARFCLYPCRQNFNGQLLHHYPQKHLFDMQSSQLYMIFLTFFCSGISGSVLALEKRESETRKTGFSCDGKFFPNDKLAKVVPEVCKKIRLVDEGEKYPSVYEGALFDNSSLVYFAYPITDKKPYASGTNY